jgi:hypothetical protein
MVTLFSLKTLSTVGSGGQSYTLSVVVDHGVEKYM